MFESMSRLGSMPSLDTVFKTTDVSPAVQAHLARVYAAMGCAVVCTGIGAYVSYAFFRVSPLGAHVTSMALMFWMAADSDKRNAPKRLIMLCAVGAWQVRARARACGRVRARVTARMPRTWRD